MKNKGIFKNLILVGLTIQLTLLSLDSYAQTDTTFGTRLPTGVFGPQFSSATFNAAGTVNPPVPYQCLPGYMSLQPGGFKADNDSDDDDGDSEVDDIVDGKSSKKPTLNEILDKAQSGAALMLPCQKEKAMKRKLSCESAEIKDDNGKLDIAKIDKLLNRNKRAVASHVCEGKKIDLIYKELDCLQAQGQQVQQFVSSMSNVFLRETQKYSQIMKDYNQTLNGLAQQQQEIALRLNGNQATGEPGIAQLEAELTRGKGTIARRISDDLNQTQKKWDAIEETAKQVKDTFEGEVIQEAQSCFRDRKSPALKCIGKGGKKGQRVACSRQDYLIQQVRSRALVDKNGRIKKRQQNVADAESLVNMVEAVLDRFYGETAKTQPRTNDANQIANFMDGKFNIVNLKDIYAYFRKSFASVNVPGINLGSYVGAAMSGCYNYAFKTVQKRSKRKGSQIDILRQRLKNLKFDADRDTDTALGNYEEDIQKIYRLLAKDSADSSHFVPPSKKICKSSTGRAETSCIRQYGEYLEKLVRGSTPDSNAVMRFAGNRFVPTKNVVCAGLAQCKTKLQQETTTFVRTVNRVRESQSDFGEAARNNYTNYVQKVAQQVGGPNGQNAIVGKHLKDLQRIIAQMGVRPGLKFNNVKPEAIKYVSAGKGPNGEDIQIPAAPTNPTALVAGLMGTPLIDFNGSNFADAVKGITKKQEDLQEDIKEVEEVSSRIEGLKSECTTEILADSADELKDLATDFRKACAWMEEYFGGKESLDQWAEDIGNIAGIWGGDIGRTLRAGVRKIETGAVSESERNKVPKIEGEIRDLKGEKRRLLARRGELTRRGDRTVASFDESIRSKEREVNSAKSSANEFDVDIQAEIENKGVYEQKVEDSRANRDEIRGKLDAARKANPVDENLVSRLVNDEKKAQAQIDGFQKRANASIDQIRKLRTDKRKAENRVRDLERGLAEVKEERSSTIERGTQEEKDEVSNRLEEIGDELRDLEARLKRAEDKKDTGQKSNYDCDSTTEELTAKRDEILSITKKYRSVAGGDKAE